MIFLKKYTWKNCLHEPIMSGQDCLSIGNPCKSMGQSDLIVNLCKNNKNKSFKKFQIKMAWTRVCIYFNDIMSKKRLSFRQIFFNLNKPYWICSFLFAYSSWHFAKKAMWQINFQVNGTVVCWCDNSKYSLLICYSWQ